MGDIEDVYDDLEADISLSAFRERVANKVEDMGGLADEETAAMLVAHELDGDRPIDIADVEPEMDAVTVLGVVRHVGEVRTFERDDGDTGAVLNLEVADESGSARAAFWDERATHAAENIDRGDTLRLKARPREGMNGIELSVTDVRLESGIDVEVATPERVPIGEVTTTAEGVILVGEILRVDDVRTFERDDGSSGQVATVVIGDESGAIAVSLWDDAAAWAGDLSRGTTIHIEGASIRERDGRLEAHVGGRAHIETAEETVEYEPVGQPIESLSEGDVATITGIVRSTDPVRTFDRDDGSEGKVRNIHVQDDSGGIRVALWGDRAEMDLGPGDPVTCIDVTVQEGFRDDLEASANWRSTIVQRSGRVSADVQPNRDPAGVDEASDSTEQAPISVDSATFTGTVIQPGDPIIIDNGTETVRVDWHGEVELGERVTVTGTREDDHIDADSLDQAENPS